MEERLEVRCHGGFVICSIDERGEGRERDERGRETHSDNNKIN